MTISVVFILIVVAGITFLTLLGKRGWTPAMRALLVLAVVPLALLFVYKARSQSTLQAPTAIVMEQPDGQQGIVTVDQAGGVLQQQVRFRPVRRPTFLFFLLFIGAFGSVVVYQVRRGAWTWPAVVKVVGLALGAGFLILLGGYWTLQEPSRSPAQDAARTIRISSDWQLVEAPRMRPVGAPEVSSEARRYRDVERWRRESVLSFVPFSAKERPDWCREGLETEPESVRLNDTEFLSSLTEGRDWIAGYSSQNPDLQVAKRDALAAAGRKLALEALLQVKEAVPEFDTLPYEDLAERLALRYSIGGPRETYIEKATLEHEQKAYGEVYRAAVRIQADPETIDALALRLCENVDGDLQGAFFSAMILVALAFSAFLMYVFIRAGATGGWVYPLRVVSGGMLLAVAAAAVYVSVNLGAL